MDTDFGQNLINLTDEDGVVYELEILSTVEYNGSLYYALAPLGTDDLEELEVSVLKAVQEDGEEILCAIKDEEELEKVYELFVDQLYEEEDEEEL